MDTSPAHSASWQTYEQVAQDLLRRFATHFKLGRIEGKQIVPGASGTTWELDAKAFRADGDGVVIVECRRHTTSGLKQEDVAAIAFRISDVGASGAILISPLDLQRGAKLVAQSANVQHAILRAGSTSTEYLMRHLNVVFAGVSDEWRIRLSDSAQITVTREDGSVEDRCVGDGT